MSLKDSDLKNFFPKRCETHPSERIRYNCIECTQQVCSSCIMEQHMTHMFEKIEFPEIIQERDIQLKIAALQAQLLSLDKVEAHLDELKDKVTDALIQKVSSESTIFHNHLEEYKIELTTLKSLTKEQLRFGSGNLRKPSLSSFTMTTHLTNNLSKDDKNKSKSNKVPPKVPPKPEPVMIVKEDILTSPRAKLNDELHFMNDHRVPFGKNIVLDNMKRKFETCQESLDEIDRVLARQINIKASRHDLKLNLLFKKAVFYKVDKNYDYAMKTCNHILDIVPNHLMTLVQKVQVYEKMKKISDMTLTLQAILASPIFDLDDYFAVGEAKFMNENTKQDGLTIIKYCAHKGNNHAQLRLGSIYFAGDSVKTDRKKGLQYFLLSANQGNPQSQYNYGYSLITGDFCPKNEVDGLRYLKMAAEQGYSNAEFRVGKYYDQTKNKSEARRWYEKAGAKGHDGALTALDFLEDGPKGQQDLYGKVTLQK